MDREKVINELEKQIASKPFLEIPTIMQQGWPVLYSTYHASNLAQQDQQMALKDSRLGELLLKRIVKQCRPSLEGGELMNDRELKNISNIGKEAMKAGGYGNYIIKSLCAEIILFNLSGRIVENPKVASSVEGLMEQLNLQQQNWKSELKKLAEDDPFLKGKSDLLDKALGEENIFGGFLALGLDSGNALTLHEHRSRSYGVMFQESNVLDLLYSTTIADLYLFVGLRGLNEYVSRSGIIPDFQKGVTPLLYEIKNKKPNLYAFPAFGVRYLSSDHIDYLVRIHRDPAAKKAFLSRLLD